MFLDAGIGLILLITPLLGFIYFIVISLIEGYLLKVLSYNNLKRSIIDSLKINLYSTLAGIIFIITFMLIGLNDFADFLRAFNISMKPSEPNWQLGRLLYLSILFILTLFIEYTVIRSLNKNSDKPLLKFILIINLVSYILIYIADLNDFWLDSL